jgi:type I restriction enzyme, S subunit
VSANNLEGNTYKSTDAGVVPTDWDVQTIGDIASVGSGGTPRRDVQAYWNGSIPWITTSRIDFSLIREADQFITEEGLRNSAAKLLPAGTLLLALYGQGKTRGKVAMLNLQAATNQACASISVRGPVSGEFLFHFLASRYEAIRNESNSGGQENLSGRIVKELSVPLPSLAEQRAIASALSDVDALLTNLDAVIAKKRDLKQAAMQQLLTGDLRLRGFLGEWQAMPLGNLFTFGGGYSASRAQLSDSGYCYLHYGDIHLSAKSFIDVESEFVELPKLYVSLNDVGAKSLLADGDVVFVDASEDDDGTSKHVVISNPRARPYISGLHTIAAKSRGNQLDTLFKRYCFQTRDVKEQFRFFAVGTKVSGISKTSIAKIELRFPSSLEEQRAIATILADMDVELAALEARRDKIRALKQGMMQELLTGRIRLI